MTSSSNNMYRVGDFVYVEQGAGLPYGVRRIDELQKSASGNVEMEVMIYLRRMEVSKECLPVADDNLKGKTKIFCHFHQMHVCLLIDNLLLLHRFACLCLFNSE